MKNENFNQNGIFLHGKFEYEKARKFAKECPKFSIDSDEDDIVNTEIKIAITAC